MIARKILVAVFLLCFIAACGVKQKNALNADIASNMPDQFFQNMGGLSAYAADTKWWLVFDDDALNQFMDTVFSENLDIAMAVQRVRQMDSVITQTGSAKYPQVDVEGRASTGVSTPEGNRMDTTTISVAASYQADIWGKIRDREAAAILSKEITEEELKSLFLTISEQAVKLYFSLVEQTLQLSALDRQIEIRKKIYDLTQKRYEMGVEGPGAVFDAETALASVMGARPSLAYNIETIRSALAVLSGKFFCDIELPEIVEIYSIPALFPEGIPSGILFQRPDILSAYKLMQIKDYEKAAAVKDRFPSLNLSASFGVGESGGEIPTVSGTIYSLAAGMVLPVLDWGSRRAAADQKREEFIEAYQGYRKAVLTAFKETEDALTNNRAMGERLDTSQRNLKAARANNHYIGERYRLGVGNYLSVLQAAYAVVEKERELYTIKNQVNAARIELASAVGGTWMIDAARKRLELTDANNNTYFQK